MAAPLEKTATQGIYKRGSRYVWSYRIVVDGETKQRWESCRTLDEARRAKRRRTADIDSGEFVEQSPRLTLHEYAREWVKTYTGRTSRGFRDETRADYSRQLEQYLLRYFGEKMLLRAVGPKDVKAFVAWLRTEQDRELSDATVQRIMAPVKAMFATAVEDEYVRRNPAASVRLSTAEKIVEDEDEVRCLSRDQLDAFLAAVEPRWRTFFELLAETGVRISEAIGLQWKHVQLTGSRPEVRIRQRIVRGRLGPPKSKMGRREIPISHDLVLGLIERRRTSEWPGDDDYVFTSGAGTALNPSNVFHRALKPAADAADVPWIGFHTLRHTCASLLFDEGRKITQVQKWLGHHKASFTLDTYISLLESDDLGGPLDLAQGANKVQTGPTPLDATRGVVPEAKTAG